MSHLERPEARILAAWEENADAWSSAIREARIESRTRVTNDALLDIVRALAPDTVLDVGCGEGWLGRALAERGIDTFGIDAVASLVAAAESARPGRHAAVPYDDLGSVSLADAPFDMAVCNFSLLGDASVHVLLRGLHAHLRDGASLVVQTLHPESAPVDHPHEDGWREGSWAGCGDGFGHPAPWYFRTLSSWRALLAGCGFAVVREDAPSDGPGEPPLSVIFVGERAR